MVNPHRNLDISDLLVDWHCHSGPNQSVIQQRDSVCANQCAPEIKPHAEFEPRDNVEIHGFRACIMQANEVPSDRQRNRLVLRPQHEGSARRIDARHLVERLRGGQGFVRDVHIEGPGELREIDDQVGRLRRHINIKANGVVCRDGAANPFFTSRAEVRVLEGVNPYGDALDAADAVRRVIDGVEDPNAVALQTREIIQRSRPVAMPVAERRSEALVIVDEKHVRAIRKERLVQRVIVQHDRDLFVIEKHAQISDQLVCDHVRHHHALDCDRRNSNGKHDGLAREAWRAVGNSLRNRHPMENARPVHVLLEWLIARERNEAILAALLILRFNSYIENVVQGGIREYDKFCSAASKGFPGRINRVGTQLDQSGVI